MDKRVKLDFEVFFTNGGWVKGEGFRLDIEGADIKDKKLADAIVADPGLLMAGQTNILNKEIITETHKKKIIEHKGGKDVLIDLSHTIEDGLITYRDYRPL